MNAYRKNVSPDATPKVEIGHDYAAAVNQRPSKWAAISLWVFITLMFSQVSSWVGFYDELALPIAAVVGLTIAWPLWAKMTSDAGSVVEQYERELEEKSARAAARKRRPRSGA